MLLLALVVASLPSVQRAGKARYPGHERHDLAVLAPPFRACVESLLAELRAAGWRPIVYSAWRDPERQEYYRSRGWSRTDRSLHARPQALAVDLVDSAPFLLLSRHAAFFLDLRERAPRHGLVTGGSWERSNPLWRRWDLGWDPAHVEPAGNTSSRTSTHSPGGSR